MRLKKKKNWNLDVQHPYSLLDKIILKKLEFGPRFLISIISSITIPNI